MRLGCGVQSCRRNSRCSCTTPATPPHGTLTTSMSSALSSVAQVASLDELHGQSQRYNGQLQEYNAKLQGELREAQVTAVFLSLLR